MGIVDQSRLLQEGLLQRHVMALIVSYLRDNNLNQAATAVANATMIPLNIELPPNKLLELVQKGLAVESSAPARGSASIDAGTSSIGYGPLPVLPSRLTDFNSLQTGKRASKFFPKLVSQQISEHKNAARCARFSPDGRLVATGGADASIKLFEVEKIQQMMLPDVGSIRPAIRTFFDHIHPINDLDFHPQAHILVSGAKDRTIKFFDFAKTSARRAVKAIQDTHNVRSVCFHPCGDFLLAGTDHPIPHLYDSNTLQCYVSASLQEKHVGSAINQVRFSESGGLYVTASKDGGVRFWDGKTARCVRAIQGAHVSAEATSAVFTRDQRYVLSCGKDLAVVLWDVGSGRQVKRYIGSQHSQTRCQAVFTHNEEFVLSSDEPKGEVVVWDALTGDLMSRLNSNHAGALRCIEHSPSEACFVTCGSDRTVRFWQTAR
ncbi:hypothetical protein SELMODRAFT_141637 [Selaginella moellendorffii]|uniref:Cleavage stimulation factor 50 kDa subunit n=1 Tax=Selaginella moellendorffii TaxID=88036 RepID=D8QXZ6_SELML|nr:cleavage stimulation factor subunit 50 [Selaginella moellendorffii]EFJ35518.1 hypothetical protein SELMODRAFT_141637 [Selaginella moellendorffii]|eukprot:XP_002963647.1 cleavage stimulation factor subunit 50 [Selaginella moellendorffii]